MAVLQLMVCLYRITGNLIKVSVSSRQNVWRGRKSCAGLAPSWMSGPCTLTLFCGRYPIRLYVLLCDLFAVNIDGLSAFHQQSGEPEQDTGHNGNHYHPVAR